MIAPKSVGQRAANNSRHASGYFDTHGVVRTKSYADQIGLIDIRGDTVLPDKETHYPALEPPDVENVSIALVKIPRNDALEQIIVGNNDVLWPDDLRCIDRQKIIRRLGIDRPNVAVSPGR